MLLVVLDVLEVLALEVGLEATLAVEDWPVAVVLLDLEQDGEAAELVEAELELHLEKTDCPVQSEGCPGSTEPLVVGLAAVVDPGEAESHSTTVFEAVVHRTFVEVQVLVEL